ncbi:MAG: cysteine hydrolase [Rhodobacterales bacterium]|nr:MAG: cysteine hydrolase [Rhodobacterales bacterium]
MTRALLLIDIQHGFDDPYWGQRNNPQAEANAARLLSRWRETGGPVFHVRHLSRNPLSPLQAGTSGAAFNPLVAPRPGEPALEKSVNSAFIGTGLQQLLQERAVRDLVICGLTTPHCVSTSARMAANLGYGVVLAHDACAAFTICADTSWQPSAPAPSAEQIHTAAINHLHGEFVSAQSTETILGHAHG